jgi:tetratricopeptide (TPR) repeat protein
VAHEFLKTLVPPVTAATLFFNMEKPDAAETWFKRLIAVNPDSKQAYYTLGVIAWTRVFQPMQAAREKIGMKPEDPGPLKDDDGRSDLRAKYLPVVQEGMDDLDKALALDPQYDDAMAYMNLLWREKADLEDSRQAYEDDAGKANVWFQRVLEIRKAKADRRTVR